MKRLWVVLPDQLSIRMLVDAGVVAGLRERTSGRMAVVFLVGRDEAAQWAPRLGDVDVLHGDDLTASTGSARERASRRVDAWLDRRLGYYPLALRLNYRHGFHAERMQPGHPNWMLDSDRDGPLPRWPKLERAMERWFFSARRHVPRRLLDAMRRDCSALVLSNVQPASAVPYLVAARRLRLPVVAHVASWDHTVGKGVISPHCDLYLVQNRVMEDDLRRSIRGEVRFDAGSRGLYATDASNFRQVPLGVVVPLDEDDLIAAVSACRRHGAPLVQRGGGAAEGGVALEPEGGRAAEPRMRRPAVARMAPQQRQPLVRQRRTRVEVVEGHRRRRL